MMTMHDVTVFFDGVFYSISKFLDMLINFLIVCYQSPVTYFAIFLICVAPAIFFIIEWLQDFFSSGIDSYPIGKYKQLPTDAYGDFHKGLKAYGIKKKRDKAALEKAKSDYDSAVAYSLRREAALNRAKEYFKNNYYDRSVTIDGFRFLNDFSFGRFESHDWSRRARYTHTVTFSGGHEYKSDRYTQMSNDVLSSDDDDE